MDSCSPGSTPDLDPDVDYKKRRSARRTVDGASRLSDRADYHVEVNVLNLSSCGFMAQCASAVQIGSYVKLDVPGLGPIDAQVRWQIGARMGGMFLDPISLGRCEWTAELVAAPKRHAGQA